MIQDPKILKSQTTYPLFAGSPNIEHIYGQDQFYQLINQSPTVNLVLFYDSTDCPNSIEFSSHYDDLADNTQYWKNIFSVTAIDCDAYAIFCTQIGITKYPELKLYDALVDVEENLSNLDHREGR